MTTKAEELADKSVTHGAYGYSKQGCRGPVCTEANVNQTLTTRAQRKDRTARYGLPAHVKHGASAYTNWGCRCDICRPAHSAECARYKK